MKSLYSDNFKDQNGRPILGAQVYVYQQFGPGAESSNEHLPEADITTADDVPITQPLVTDINGLYSFKAEDALYRIDVWFGGKLVYSSGNVVVGDPAIVYKGDTGPANSTFSSYADMRAAPVTNLSYNLVGTAVDGAFFYEEVNAPYTADDVDIFKLDDVSLSVGALVRQKAGTVSMSHGESYNATSVGEKLKKTVHVTDHPFGCVCDGTDETTKVAAALQYLDDINGGTLVFPMTADGGVVGVSGDTWQIPENVTVDFQGGSVKVLGVTSHDAAFMGVPGATNICVINPQIDCNNVRAASGIIMRRNNPEFIVIGGVIKNCAHDAVGDPGNPDPELQDPRLGGRAINIEAGVDPVAYGRRNAVVMGTIAKNCYDGLSMSGGTPDQEESNIRVDMVADTCESAISTFGNTASYPHNPKAMGGHITMTARNCGKSVAYTRPQGVVNFDRGSNFRIDLQVENDADYGAVGSLLRGDFSNCVVNAKMTGEVTRAILDFASYQEVEAIDEDATWTASGDTLSTLDSEFNIKHTGTAADVFNLPISAAAFLTNCRAYIKTDIVTTLKPINANMANKTTCWVRVQNKTSNTIIQGYASNIGSAVTFANCANEKYNMDRGNVRARGRFVGATGAATDMFMATVSRVSEGIFDVTLAVEMPNANYVVSVEATQSSTSTVQYREAYSQTTTGFRIETRNNNVVSDPTAVWFTVTL